MPLQRLSSTGLWLFGLLVLVNIGFALLALIFGRRSRR